LANDRAAAPEAGGAQPAPHECNGTGPADPAGPVRRL